MSREDLDGNAISSEPSLLDLVPSLEHSITGLMTNHGEYAKLTLASACVSAPRFELNKCSFS